MKEWISPRLLLLLLSSQPSLQLELLPLLRCPFPFLFELFKRPRGTEVFTISTQWEWQTTKSWFLAVWTKKVKRCKAERSYAVVYRIEKTDERQLFLPRIYSSLLGDKVQTLLPSIPFHSPSSGCSLVFLSSFSPLSHSFSMLFFFAFFFSNLPIWRVSSEGWFFYRVLFDLTIIPSKENKKFDSKYGL